MACARRTCSRPRHRDVYQMHDLLRLFATELAGTELDRDERAQALERLVTWYWAAMQAAAAAIVEGRPIPDFADYGSRRGGGARPSVPRLPGRGGSGASKRRAT